MDNSRFSYVILFFATSAFSAVPHPFGLNGRFNRNPDSSFSSVPSAVDLNMTLNDYNFTMAVVGGLIGVVFLSASLTAVIWGSKK